MSVALHYRPPANDPRLEALPAAPSLSDTYADFLRPFWGSGRIIIAIFAFFAAYAAGLTFDSSLPDAGWKMPFAVTPQLSADVKPAIEADKIPIIETESDQTPEPNAVSFADLPFTPVPVSIPDMQPQPDGIAIDASALAVPDADAEKQIASALPESAFDAKSAHKQNKSPPVLNVEIDKNASGQGGMEKNRHEAAKDDASAQFFLRAGAVDRAIDFEQRAVGLDPENVSYKLSLAILFDRAGDMGNAITYYRQVVSAYDGQDAPPDIVSVKRRLDYLSTDRE